MSSQNISVLINSEMWCSQKRVKRERNERAEGVHFSCEVITNGPTPNTSFAEWGKCQENWVEALLSVQKSTSGKAVSANIKSKL